ncbi:unnamed protein product, partial [Amoebophrya sp. A25]|eukprot:GSA25T00023381001.1
MQMHGERTATRSPIDGEGIPSWLRAALGDVPELVGFYVQPLPGFIYRGRWFLRMPLLKRTALAPRSLMFFPHCWRQRRAPWHTAPYFSDHAFLAITFSAQPWRYFVPSRYVFGLCAFFWRRPAGRWRSR